MTFKSPFQPQLFYDSVIPSSSSAIRKLSFESDLKEHRAYISVWVRAQTVISTDLQVALLEGQTKK